MTVLQVAVQRLLLVVAALALVSHGGVPAAPRLVAAGAAPASAAPAAPHAARGPARPAAESAPVAPASSLRAPTALVAPSSGGETAAGRGATPVVAPHPVARPVVRPPTRSSVLGMGGGASGRAPPAPAGT